MKTTRLGEYELSQLMLGTAQFGLAYGVANKSGQPGLDEVCAILRAAHEGGVNCLDTAPFYGESEEVLGRALAATNLRDKMTVVTKSLRLADENSSADGVYKMAESEVLQSLGRLQLEVLPLCLIHVQENFRYVEALLKLKEKGLIRHVGCSTVTPDATLEIIRSGLCEAIQIPTNILDRRFTNAGVLREAKERGVAVFVRSSYLQGLILMEPDEVPDDLKVVIPALQTLRSFAGENSLTIEELALRYVLSLEGLSSAVVGVESVAQITRNLEIFEAGALNAEQMQRIAAFDFQLPDLVFQPFRWQKRMPDAPKIRA
jgi:aryl-alcohol dehydrogenase-like predicted oxidoreductase